MLEVNDKAELLVRQDGDFAVFILHVRSEPIYPANCLKERVVAHVAVNVENSRRWRIEACEQFINYNEKLHLRWAVQKTLLGLFLVLLDAADAEIRKRLERHIVLELQLVLFVRVGRVLAEVIV